jgi:hypothetical protein
MSMRSYADAVTQRFLWLRDRESVARSWVATGYICFRHQFLKEAEMWFDGTLNLIESRSDPTPAMLQVALEASALLARTLMKDNESWARVDSEVVKMSRFADELATPEAAIFAQRERFGYHLWRSQRSDRPMQDRAAVERDLAVIRGWPAVTVPEQLTNLRPIVESLLHFGALDLGTEIFTGEFLPLAMASGEVYPIQTAAQWIRRYRLDVRLDPPATMRSRAARLALHRVPIWKRLEVVSRKG